MLQQIHMAKQQKNEKEFIKEQAQDEARQRREKARLRQRQHADIGGRIESIGGQT